MTKFITDSYKANIVIHDALVEEVADFVSVSWTTNKYYLMCNAAESEYIDVATARQKKMPPVRALHAPAGPYSIIAMDKGSLIVSARLPDSSQPSGDPAHQLMLAIRDTANAFGLNATVDYNSTKVNDLLIDGEKFSGYAQETYNGDFVFGAFISLSHDKNMYKNIWAPTELLERKAYDSVSDRVTSIRQHDKGITAQDLITEFKNQVENRFPITLTDTSVPEAASSRYDTIFQSQTSDSEVFKH